MLDSTSAWLVDGSRTANGKLNGKPRSWTRKAKIRRGFFSRALSLVARLTIWSIILTVLFRCPSSLEACDETSPLICSHYFRAKATVAPRLQPYYERYASSYVHVVKPYYQAVDSHILTPTRVYAVRYGAPWVNKARARAWSQWEVNGQPRLTQLQDLTAARYDQSIAPHVARAGRAVKPYYRIARANLLQLYYKYAMPGYEFIHPHAARSYAVARNFTSNKALPATFWIWNKGNLFLETAVWPQLRLLYKENVEPQLVRIGERLGRYKNKAQSKVLQQSGSPKTAASSSEPTQSHTTPSSSTVSESVAPDFDVDGPDFEGSSPKYLHPVKAPTPRENENEMGRNVREMVTHDLETWQEKFMSQAEEKAHEIEDRVDAIAQRSIEMHLFTTGRQLLGQLNSTAESEVDQLKRTIVSIVKENPANAQESAIAAVRSAGIAIKNSAQAIREWRENFDAQLKTTVNNDVEEYFDILDETRSLALQKIGMKWAWTNGISYHDWAKYHELKNALGQLTNELRELVVTHPGLIEAQDASAMVETQAMTIAAGAAQELSRLKEVARWKLLARDTTDSFDFESMKSAAEAAQTHSDGLSDQSEEPNDALVGISPVIGIFDSADGATSKPEELVSEQAELSSSDTKATSAASMSHGRADDVETDITDSSGESRQAGRDGFDDEKVKSKVAFGAAAQEVPDRRPILDEVGDSDLYADATSAAQAAYSSAFSAASERYSSALSVVSAQVYGTPKPVHEQLMASVSAAYGSAVAAASQRLDGAVSAASRGAYGTPTPTSGLGSLNWEKVESMAAQRLNEGRLWAEVQYQSALMALGVATPTPSADNAVEKAKFRYYAGLGIAQDRYTSFLAAASLAWSSVTATPTPTDLRGSASWAASAASASASSVAQAAGSAAQAAGSAAQSAYSAATESVASVARAADDSLSSVADAASEQVSIAAVAIAGTWEKVLLELSAQIYAEPTAIGWGDRLLDGASSCASAATETATEKAAAVTDAARSAADAASAQAARQFDAVHGIVSELVSGREPAYSESVLSRLSAAYATASANVGSLASQASASAASVGERLGVAASHATEAVKESVQQGKDEL
ncbi:transcription factor hoxa13 [Ophiocordyceps camponoti-floridani]|uniref:Transcription factor hoxa13 n=1 Tax=Ophiocordyceps camponoti-floridani TaxID=2030778 RepID=A0A8H4Q0D9_9HYPO|nr:transcription factor hoxa13 [Ophiocordyceps camponoti-floridani]